VDYHEEPLFTDLALSNRKLADWLVFYNASASAPFPQPAISVILPHATSTRVPKVLDSYRYLTHTPSNGYNDHWAFSTNQEQVR